MKNPIIAIIMFLALSLGIIVTRLATNLQDEPSLSNNIDDVATISIANISPSANAAQPIETTKLKTTNPPLNKVDPDELFNILASSGVPEQQDADKNSAVKCNIEKQISCTAKGCEELPSEIWLELDFANNLYKRCKENDCKNFSMLVKKKQSFSSITIPSNSVALRISNKEGYFSEATSLAGTIINNFGNCPSAAKYLSSL